MASESESSVAEAQMEEWYHSHVSHMPADMYNLGNPAYWYCEECEAQSEDDAADASGIKHVEGCIAEIIGRFLYGEVRQ